MGRLSDPLRLTFPGGTTRVHRGKSHGRPGAALATTRVRGTRAGRALDRQHLKAPIRQTSGLAAR
jgi:hypothetical protein